MADYAVNGSQTVASPDDSTLTIERGASKRAKVYDFTSGFTIASPTDNLLTVTAQVGSASGTGTSFTPLPVDPADGASVTTCEVNHTIEPTYTAGSTLLVFGQHMRATYRWVAAPGKEWVIPNTAGALIGFFATHASVTPEHLVTGFFSE